MTKKNKDKIIYYWGVIHLAILYYEQDDIEKCAQLLQDHSDSFSKLDVVWRLGFSSFLDGLVAERLGNYKEADRLIFKGIQNFERNWVPYYLAACWFCRSKIASASGNWTLAWDYLKTSLEINQKHIKLLGLAENLELAGMLYIETGEPEKAGLLLVKAKQMRLELGTPVPPVLESDIQGAWVKLQEHFTPEKLEQLSEKVKAMSREEVLALV